jgi:hypothetical protein
MEVCKIPVLLTQYVRLAGWELSQYFERKRKIHSHKTSQWLTEGTGQAEAAYGLHVLYLLVSVYFV